MKLNIKRLSEKAVLPSYASTGDNGLDLTAINYSYDAKSDYYNYNTGLAVEIPSGYVGLLFPRSSISKYDLTLANSVGVIDSSYRGEIQLRFKLTNFKGELPNTYKIGDKIGQLVIIASPVFEVTEVNELTETQRGTGAYGSSGR